MVLLKLSQLGLTRTKHANQLNQASQNLKSGWPGLDKKLVLKTKR